MIKETIEEVMKVSGDEFSKSICLRGDSCRMLQEDLRENEKLREIFQFAVLEFEKRNRKIAFLEEGLRERYYDKKAAARE